MNNNTIPNTAEITMEGFVLMYTPLVKATAYRYQGRGAEFEDLVQEGYLALLTLIPKCKDMQWLSYFLKSRLPGYVRAAAQRIRGSRRPANVELEKIEGVLSDSKSVTQRAESDLREVLERTLTQSELDLTQALLEGFTQKELASLLNITQQAVSARVHKIRNKLRPVVETWHKDSE